MKLFTVLLFSPFISDEESRVFSLEKPSKPGLIIQDPLGLTFRY